MEDEKKWLRRVEVCTAVVPERKPSSAIVDMTKLDLLAGTRLDVFEEPDEIGRRIQIYEEADSVHDTVCRLHVQYEEEI
jgi:hypothetical protein